jgi:hypothetical protein
MLRIVQSQRNRAMLAISSRIQLSRGTVLFSTNAAEVFDDEANRQQLEQVSQQMEDAMHKEKQISSQMHQASNNVSPIWDAGSQTVNDPSDERIPQSKAPEMNAIQGEVRDQARQRVGDDLSKQEKTSPMGFQTDGPSRTRDYGDHQDMYVDNGNKNLSSSDSNMTIDPSKMMDQVKDMASGAVNLAAGVGKVIQETAKASINNVKDMMPSSSNDDSWKQRDMPPGRNYSQNTTTSGGFMQDTAKVTMDGVKDFVEGVMKPSTDSPGKVDEQLKRQQREWQGRNIGGSSGATQAGEETQQASRGKQYPEHRQNASLS